MTVEHLHPATPPHRDRVLALLDRTRTEAEQGRTLAVVVIAVHPANEFSVDSAGEVSMLELAGMLGRAWMDATEGLRR